jgi:hypothetical protein
MRSAGLDSNNKQVPVKPSKSSTFRVRFDDIKINYRQRHLSDEK